MDPQTILQALIGQYGWLAAVGFTALIFRRTLESIIDGLMIFVGNDYNVDDVVIINKKPGRIVRVGLWKTVFFVYTVEDGTITHGSKLVVQNSKIKNMIIEKPLTELNLQHLSTKIED